MKKAALRAQLSPSTTWEKSARSGPYSDNCVEVAQLDGGVAVRDSENPAGPVLVFTRGEWDAFTGGVRDGEPALS